MAWIPYVASAAASLYSAKKQGDAAKKIGNEQERLYGGQADLLKELSPFAIDYFKKSRAAYDPAFRYYSSIAGGDRSAMLGALSPELSSIGGRYRSLAEASRTLMPRGGSNASFNANLLYREGDEKQALINQARSGAFANLAKLSGVAGDLGSAAAGNAVGAGAGASGILGDIFRMNTQAGKSQAEAYAAIGKLIADSIGYDQNSGWFIGKQAGRG